MRRISIICSVTGLRAEAKIADWNSPFASRSRATSRCFPAASTAAQVARIRATSAGVARRAASAHARPSSWTRRSQISSAVASSSGGTSTPLFGTTRSAFSAQRRATASRTGITLVLSCAARSRSDSTSPAWMRPERSASFRRAYARSFSVTRVIGGSARGAEKIVGAAAVGPCGICDLRCLIVPLERKEIFAACAAARPLQPVRAGLQSRVHVRVERDERLLLGIGEVEAVGDLRRVVALVDQLDLAVLECRRDDDLALDAEEERPRVRGELLRQVRVERGQVELTGRDDRRHA